MFLRSARQDCVGVLKLFRSRIVKNNGSCCGKRVSAYDLIFDRSARACAFSERDSRPVKNGMQFGSDRSAGLQCGGLYQAITQPDINWRVLAIPVTSSYTCRMNYWIFQGNPDIFDIDTSLAQNEEIVWQVRQEHLAKLYLYDGKCAITGWTPAEVLEAAHLHSQSASGVNRSGNGLLLRSDLHALLDAGLLDIDTDCSTDPCKSRPEEHTLLGVPQEEITRAS